MVSYSGVRCGVKNGWMEDSSTKVGLRENTDINHLYQGEIRKNKKLHPQ